MLRFSALLLPAVLLSLPPVAQAQTPAKNLARKVSFQVVFVAVKTSDLDALGMNFDLVPISESPKLFLVAATNSIVPQSYRLLTHSVIEKYIFTPPPLTVSDNTPAVFVVSTSFGTPIGRTTKEQDNYSFPRFTSTGQLRGKVTFVPHIRPNNMISLEIASPLGDSQPVKLRVVPSGQQIVINTAVVKPHGESNTLIVPSGGQMKVSHAIELLMFVTPTITSDAQVTQNPDGAYMFTAQSPKLLLVRGYSMPPPHFSGEGSSKDFGSFGFGSFGGFSEFGDSHFQWQPVEFSRTPPAKNLELPPKSPKMKAAGITPPSGIERIYAQRKSF